VINITRYIIQVCQDSDGDIVEVKFNDYTTKLLSDAVKEIENGISYKVKCSNGKEYNLTVGVHTVKGINKKFLRTDPDGININNLDNLEKYHCYK